MPDLRPTQNVTLNAARHLPWWRYDDAKFFLQDSPWMLTDLQEHGIQSEDPLNLNETMASDQTKMLESLTAADRDYREILTAAASLISSLQSLRAGLVAL
jgi:hypothetical protein